MKRILYLSLLLVSFFGCNNNSTNPNEGLFIISGVVSDSNGPIVNALVTVDKKYNWETKTSQSGEFKITKVSAGNHNLYIQKTSNDSSFVENSYSLDVTSDLSLNDLILPTPVKLYVPYNISQTEMTLSWNRTYSDDFREYKLYRRDTPGLDETTGELIYVSTSIGDTSFSDINLVPYKTYYYRVYIMNEFGRIGGSNISTASTLGGNLIPDGNFEDTSSFNRNWFILYNNADVSYTDSTKVNGNYSLFLQIPSYVTIKTKKAIRLAGGQEYELSGYGKANGTYYPTEEWVLMTVGGDNYNGAGLMFCYLPSLVDSVDIDWTFKSTYFTPDKDVSVYVELIAGFRRVWYDSLKLEAVQ